MQEKREFLLDIYHLGIIKFGDFTLKSGLQSPFYIDMRPLASSPKILKKLSSLLLQMISDNAAELICGVPYAALPIATAMSLGSNIPLIVKRKEAKAYGTKKLIEGVFQPGQNCLLIEDVITSGISLTDTIAEVEQEGLEVTDIVVILDREQGGSRLLQEQGYKLRSLFTISEAAQILHQEKLLDDEKLAEIKNFIDQNNLVKPASRRPSYQIKLKNTTQPVAKKLLETAIEKRSNLILSADVTATEELLNLAEIAGPHVVALKTHIDILTDFDYQKTIVPLKELAAKHRFLLMEDRKFADIGHTQQLQFQKGIYRISEWADFVTAQVIAGETSLEAFGDSGVVAILSMSSKNNLTDKKYFDQALNIAQKNSTVIGGVSQIKLPAGMIHFVPGVNLESKGDALGQNYNTPELVFHELGADFMIVGRGIYAAENVLEQTIRYQKVGWEAYENSLNT